MKLTPVPWVSLWFMLGAAFAPPAQAQAGAAAMALQVDATDLVHKVMKVRQTIPVAKPGPVALAFPRWIPGTHGPYGDVGPIAGLKFSAAGQTLVWSRDPLDTHRFTVELPAAARALDVEFDAPTPVGRETGRIVMTPDLLNVQWNALLLYPAGVDAKTIRVEPALRIPSGWKVASALRVASEAVGNVRFEAETLERLVDSPVYAGRHVRRIELDPPGTPKPVALNLFADDARGLEGGTEAQIDAHRRMVQQSDRVFGARPWRGYEFLFAISDELSEIGLEHLESSENAIRASGGTRYWDGWDKTIAARELLPHEFAHAWSGKYRRPADMATPDFEQPMQGSLLWVYEGATEYWGKVIAARSGLVNPEVARDGLAVMLAGLVERTGRRWRDLQDTTAEPVLGRRTARDWPDWQRTGGSDYYYESVVLWLEADALIREKTGETRSLDDFARSFYAASGDDLGPNTYRFDDVVRALDAVAPHDWAGFLRQRTRLRDIGDLLGAFERASGWKLAWSDTPSENWKSREAFRRFGDFTHSIGLRIAQGDGRIVSVAWDGPAFRAGVAPGALLLAVNGRAYKPEAMQAAITANRDGSAPIELLLREGDRFRTVRVDYRGGLRYPRLERIAGQDDRLARVLAPR